MATGKAIIGNVYPWTSSDTIAAVSTTENASYPLSRLVDENEAFHLSRVARTSAAGLGDGFIATLAAETTISVVAILGLDDSAFVATPQGRIRVENAATADTLDANGIRLLNSQIYTYSGISRVVHDTPVNVDVIPGVDAATVPTAAGALATVACKKVEFTLAAAGTTYVQAGAICLGINCIELTHGIPLGGMATRPKLLRDGSGFSWTVSFKNIRKADADHIWGVWQASQGGALPIVCMFAPGAKDSSGILNLEEHHPAMRGGVVRMVSPPQFTLAVEGADWYATTGTLEVATWQENDAGGF